MIGLVILSETPVPAAERFALEQCVHYGYSLMVAVVSDTRFARYGFVDQLASAGCMSEFSDYVEGETRDKIAMACERMQRVASIANVEFSVHQLDGDPAEVLSSWVTKNRISRLVVGDHPRSGLLGMGEGTPERIFRKSPCVVELISPI